MEAQIMQLSFISNEITQHNPFSRALFVTKRSTFIFLDRFCFITYKNTIRSLLLIYVQMANSVVYQIAVLALDCTVIQILIINSMYQIFNLLCLDNCTLNNIFCHSNAMCNFINQTYQCNCKKGFTGDGMQCSGKYIIWKMSLVLK